MKNNLLFYFEKFSGFEKEQKKGDFIEYILYDYFESFGYRVSLCKTEEKTQRLKNNRQIIIPDILVESYPNYLFFCESKSSWTEFDKVFKIREDYISAYKGFYNIYPHSFRESRISDCETKIIFSDIVQCGFDNSRVDHYVVEIKECLKFAKKEGREYIWSLDALNKYTERISQELYHPTSFDEVVISSSYCENIYAKERYTWFYSESDLKNLAAGKRKNVGDGW